MLPLSLVLEIRRLLDEGELTQRAIAEQLGVCRGTVNALASGRRGLYGNPERVEATTALELRPAPRRCPGCGGFVHAPCRLCAIREYRRRRNLLYRLYCTQPKPQGPRRVA